MGRNGSLKYQLFKELDSRTRFGESRHKAKEEGIQKEYIYSYSTYENYKYVAGKFADYMRANHPNIKSVADARMFVAEYLQSRINDGLSPYTVAKDAAALGKIYQCKTTDFGVPLPTRHRNDIKRGRDRHSDTARHRNFKEENHREFVTFCKCFGPRRSELGRIKLSDFKKINGNLCVHLTGKGGKSRYARFCGSDKELSLVLGYLKALSFGKGKDELLFSTGVNTNANIHGYRADYAVRLYQSLARPLDELESYEKYRCRNDMQGKVFDKDALAEVSKNLGHGEGRYGTVVSNYLYTI